MSRSSKKPDDVLVYESNSEWLLQEHEGEYVLIVDQSIIGVYGSYEQAVREGYSRFGIVPILVQQILATENVEFSLSVR